MVVPILDVCLATLAIVGMSSAQTVPDTPQDHSHRPALINTCLITRDVKGLVGFYESVLKLEAHWSGEEYAEFRTGVGVLAIFSAQAQDRYIPGSTIAGNNRGVVLEFRVGDVDQEFRRLLPVVKTWVKPPTTQPWGSRSFYFRDPDGNLVDFYSQPATP
jgi:catechol 2,3-dioxygenase-like lactoylglutathione lyase family enzyme